MKEISNKRKKLKASVKRLHHISETFLSQFPTVCYPDFLPELKKKRKGGLAKRWKGPMQMLAFGRHRNHLRARMKKVGNEMIGISEVCSTMAQCVCGTLHSPGTHFVHHCPNKECKKVTLRDECGRIMGIIADTKILQRKAELADGRNGIPNVCN